MNKTAETEIVADLAQCLAFIGGNVAKFQPVGLNGIKLVDGFKADQGAADHRRQQQKGDPERDKSQSMNFDI